MRHAHPEVRLIDYVTRELTFAASYFGSWGGDYDYQWTRITTGTLTPTRGGALGAQTTFELKEMARGELGGVAWSHSERTVLRGRIHVTTHQSAEAVRELHQQPWPRHRVTGVCLKDWIAWVGAEAWFSRLGRELRPVPPDVAWILADRPFVSILLGDPN